MFKPNEKAFNEVTDLKAKIDQLNLDDFKPTWQSKPQMDFSNEKVTSEV